jgi:hypothetical protein
MPHSIIHGDACFAYFNKIWGIPHAKVVADSADGSTTTIGTRPEFGHPFGVPRIGGIAH